jgi:hypothetical protein
LPLLRDAFVICTKMIHCSSSSSDATTSGSSANSLPLLRIALVI